jgi:hypothetical protein
VTWNTFFEVEPVIEAGTFVNAEDFGEELLRLERLALEEGVWRTAGDHYVLDLGWSPAESPNGSYRLSLLRGNWEHVLKTYENRNVANVRDMIEHWLSVLSANWHDSDAHLLL